MRFKFGYHFLLILTMCVSCADDEDVIELNEEVTFGIRHDRSLSEYENIAASFDRNLPDFSPVVAFEYSLDGSDNYDFVATGVLIEQDWVLTAAHNFYDAEEQDNPAPASGVTILVGNDPNNPRASYGVSDIIFHPTWLEGNQDLNDANDLCLVKLSTTVPDISPAVLYADTNEPLGNQVWHCGFGDYSQLAGQDPDLISKKHAMENLLDRVQGGFQTSTGGVDYPGGLLAFDFDDPAGTLNTLGDDIVNEDEGYLGLGSSSSMALSFEGTTVEGDSGGPLFLKNNDGWEVAGILSGGAFEPVRNHSDGNYGDISIYTRVSTSIDWIRSIIE